MAKARGIHLVNRMIEKLNIEFLKKIPEHRADIMENISRMKLPASSKILMAYFLNHTWADTDYLYLPPMNYWRNLSKIPSFSRSVQKLVANKCVGKCMIGQIRVLYPLNIKNKAS